MGMLLMGMLVYVKLLGIKLLLMLLTSSIKVASKAIKIVNSKTK